MTLLLLLDQTQTGNPADVLVTLTEPPGPLEVGDLVRRVVLFRDPITHDPVEPGTVTAQVRDPYGTTTTIAPSALGDGTYQIDVTADMDGTWTYRVIGSYPYPGAIEKRFTVQPTAFAA